MTSLFQSFRILASGPRHRLTPWQSADSGIAAPKCGKSSAKKSASYIERILLGARLPDIPGDLSWRCRLFGDEPSRSRFNALLYLA